METTSISHSLRSGWDAAIPDLDSDQTVVLVFGAPEYRDRPAVFAELRAAFPTSHVIGCSTAGEIHGFDIRDESLSVGVARFDATRVACAAAQVQCAAESESAGRTLADRLRADDLRSVFVLSDGTDVNGTALVNGLNSVLPESVVVTGGLAGDGPRFQQTWTLAGDAVAPGRAVAIGLYGTAVDVAHGSRGGWDIFGPERVVTRSRGNVLYELDGRPALTLYREYLGELAAGLPATGLLFPLALRRDETRDEQVVRTILAVDEAAGALVFAGDIPEGRRVQLMQANFERLVMGAEAAAEEAVFAGAGGPGLTIAISCVGRRLVLGEHAEEEVEAIGDVLGDAMTQVGFYSYGELSPLVHGRCDLHNQTMTLTVITES